MLALSLRQKNSSGTASAKQNAPVAGNANGAGASAKSAKSENSSPETAGPAAQVDAGANSSVAVLPLQIQALPDAQAGTPTQVRSETSAAGSSSSSHSAVQAGVTANATAAASAQMAASQTAQPAGSAQGTAAVQLSPEGASNSVGALQGQAASLIGAPATETPPDAASGTQQISSTPSKLTVEISAPGIAVTDVRTHFTPEARTAKSQALDSAATDTASTLAADLSSATGAASGAGQGYQPVQPVEGATSHGDRSGGQASTPAPADKQAAQASGVTTAPEASLSGQAVPSPMQQVFDGIQSAVPASAEGQSAAAASSPSTPDGYQPLKTITIALQPDGLGTVAIQLSLKSSQLGIRVEASESSTAQLLRQHGGDLSGAAAIGRLCGGQHCDSRRAPKHPGGRRSAGWIKRAKCIQHVRYRRQRPWWQQRGHGGASAGPAAAATSSGREEDMRARRRLIAIALCMFSVLPRPLPNRQACARGK